MPFTKFVLEMYVNTKQFLGLRWRSLTLLLHQEVSKTDNIMQILLCTGHNFQLRV